MTDANYPQLPMELRAVDAAERTISGVVAPYDAVSYLTRDPAGERMMRGAFTRSIEHADRGRRVKLCVDHDHRHPVGLAETWTDDDAGLSAVFRVRKSELGDQALEDAREGYMTGLSVGFETLRQGRGADGVREIREARLHEVSLVMIPAYSGAEVLAVRRARPIEDILAPFVNRPQVDLSPIPAVWLYDATR